RRRTSALVIAWRWRRVSQRLALELSDELYTMIQRQATEARISSAQVATASLERYFHEQPGAQRKARRQSKNNTIELQTARERFEKHFGSVDLGYATGTGNEEI